MLLLLQSATGCSHVSVVSSAHNGQSQQWLASRSESWILNRLYQGLCAHHHPLLLLLTLPTTLCLVCSDSVHASAYMVPAELAMMLNVLTPGSADQGQQGLLVSLLLS